MAEVIQVAEGAANLDPVVETAEVQRMINSHNASLRTGNTFSSSPRLQIKRTVYFTGYLISPSDTAKLLTLINLPSGMPESEVKFLANNILITPRPSPKSILDKVGGIGNKVIWQITGTAVYENKIWAARVAPIPSNTTFYSENPVPIVVLALRKGARPIDAKNIQNWQPVSADRQFIFETVVGEKVQLRVEEEVEGEGEWESLFANKSNKRRHPQEDDENGRSHHLPPIGPQQGRFGGDENRRPHGNNNHNSNNYRGGNQNRGRSNGGGRHAPRGGRGNNRGGGGGGGGGRGRARGGYGGYRSLDDMTDGARYGQGGSHQHTNVQPSYDDSPSQGFGTQSGEGYNASFPPIGGAGYGNGNSRGNGGGGGLPYGQ